MRVLRDMRNSRDAIIYDNLGYTKRVSFYCYTPEAKVEAKEGEGGMNKPASNDSIYWVFEAPEIDTDVALQEVIKQCDDVKALKTLVLLKITRKMEAVAQKQIGELGLEAQTWQLQKMELEAFRASSKAPTPLCDQIAKGRGITKEELMAKIEAKSGAYVTGVGALLGMKQNLEDKITNANDVNTLRGIDWA